jgi:hypothetical protein
MSEGVKPLLLNAMTCGFSFQVCITPFGVGKTAQIEANASKTLVFCSGMLEVNSR